MTHVPFSKEFTTVLHIHTVTLAKEIVFWKWVLGASTRGRGVRRRGVFGRLLAHVSEHTYTRLLSG